MSLRRVKVGQHADLRAAWHGHCPEWREYQRQNRMARVTYRAEREIERQAERLRRWPRDAAA